MNQAFSYFGMVLAFMLYLFLQVNVLDPHLALGGFVTPQLLVLFLLMMPLRYPLPLQYLIAFIAGLLLDTLSGTYINGAQAFSCLLMVGLRGFWLRIISAGGYRPASEISLTDKSLSWYVTFLLPMIAIHHTAYYMVEAFGFQHFFYTLLKIILGTIYTFVLAFLVCVVFYKNGRSS